jgi:PhzF family phenazine biosynthesis protein
MTMTIPYFVVDAFTDRPFAGNPAAVCPLSRWLPDATLAAIAAEMALSETAFFVPEDDGFRLRWLTPTVEVDLCGHATLATAHVLFHLLEPARSAGRFHTRSGALTVTRAGDGATLDFPARIATPIRDGELVARVTRAIGAPVRELHAARNFLAVVDDAATVRSLAPDIRQVMALPTEGLIVTAAGDDVDFVSRYFTPQHGIDEDPVTGSTHCTLAPWWAERLGKNPLRARQLSRRGGAMTVEVAGDRVRMTGAAVLMARGELLIAP